MPEAGRKDYSKIWQFDLNYIVLKCLYYGNEIRNPDSSLFFNSKLHFFFIHIKKFQPQHAAVFSNTNKKTSDKPYKPTRPAPKSSASYQVAGEQLEQEPIVCGEQEWIGLN